MPMGHSRAADAVLDMNWVRPQDRMNSTAVTIIGDGVPPIRPTAHSAITLPAPVLLMAEDTGIMPANRKMVTQSMEAYACFSVSTETIAPVMAAISRVTPLIPRAMVRTTANRITPETIIFEEEVEVASTSCSIS